MALLEYLYSDHTPMEERDPVGILVLANQFCQPRLVALAEYYITRELQESISDTCTETSDVDVVDIMEKSKVGILICAILFKKTRQFMYVLHTREIIQIHRIWNPLVKHRADSRFAPSQCETSLQSSPISRSVVLRSNVCAYFIP